MTDRATGVIAPSPRPEREQKGVGIGLYDDTRERPGLQGPGNTRGYEMTALHLTQALLPTTGAQWRERSNGYGP